MNMSLRGLPLLVLSAAAAARAQTTCPTTAVYTPCDIVFELNDAEAAAHPLPTLSLTRGARHLAFLPGGRALVLLRGEIQHKNLWLIDLETGAERQLTNFSPDFDIRDFDISPDGREVVLERVQERADVVLLDLPRP